MEGQFISMDDRFSRTAMLIGDEALSELKKSRVAVFGIGGVGGSVCEALARAGVGSITLIDNDTVSRSNINRQIIALESTVGLKKTEAAMMRLRDINPDIDVACRDMFILPENADEFDFSSYDYVVDAIDTVSGKLAIIEGCSNKGVPVISSMGTGNKLDATGFIISDIYKTSVCPLARVMRHECKKRGIKKLKVLYSQQEPVRPSCSETSSAKPVPGSISYVPTVAGLLIAGEVIKDIINKK